MISILSYYLDGSGKPTIKLFDDIERTKDVALYVLSQTDAGKTIEISEVSKNEYTLQAECLHDVILLIELLPSENVLFWNIENNQGNFPDVILKIVLRNMMIDDLKTIIKKIPDSHIMYNTITNATKCARAPG